MILGSAYLAPVEYYTKLFAYDTVHIERFDHYMKQTYRNRCVIASAGGGLALTIPTEKSEDLKCLMKDIRISDHGNWRHVHWNAFVAAYKQSPFFDYYADEFHRFFEQKYEFLFDFNLELCNWVCEQIDLHPHLLPTDDYITSSDDSDDFRELIHPKNFMLNVIRNSCPNLIIRCSIRKTIFYLTSALWICYLTWDLKVCWFCVIVL